MPRAKTLPRSMPLIDFLEEKNLLDDNHLPRDFQTTQEPKQIYLRKIKGRMIVAVTLLAMVFVVPAYRLSHLAMNSSWQALTADNKKFTATPAAYNLTPRGKIYDRNGFLLAGNLPTLSLVARPQNILNPQTTATKLTRLLPYLQKKDLLKKFRAKNNKRIILAQNLDPALKNAILNLGEPGLEIGSGSKRFYPSSRVGAAAMGFVNSKNQGVSGMERFFNKELLSGKDVVVSIDSRVQNFLEQELTTAMVKHNASAAGGVVLDIKTGEVLGLSSLPGFDPNNRTNLKLKNTFSMVTGGSYELGSVMKIITMAQWLDQQKIQSDSNGGEAWRSRLWDVTKPLAIDNYTINDLHPIKRTITSDEVFIYSSNIGVALLIEDMAVKDKTAQRDFLQSLHLLSKMDFELPDQEVGRPLIPKTWGKIESATVSFGHGISLPPIQFATAVAALMGDGVWRAPTLTAKANSRNDPITVSTLSNRTTANNGTMAGLVAIFPSAWQEKINGLSFFQSKATAEFDANKKSKVEVIGPATRAELRRLMRLNVLAGSGQRILHSSAKGYEVGGKTGTAEKLVNGRYDRGKNMTSFISAFPMTQPRYLVFLLLDNTDKGDLASATLAPTTGSLIGKIAPLLAIVPSRAAEKANDKVLKKLSHFTSLRPANAPAAATNNSDDLYDGGIGIKPIMI